MEFLVVGAGRSGTTLLAGVLDYHHGLALDVEHGAGILTGTTPLTPPERRIKMLYRRSEAFADECDRRAAEFPGRRYGNKITTEMIMALENHNRWVDPPVDVAQHFFGEALEHRKVVEIVRDGRTCVASKLRRSRKAHPDEVVERWRYAVRIHRHLVAGDTPTHVVRFEELVAEPAVCLAGVCDFLGVEFAGEMLAGTDNTIIRADYRRRMFDESVLDATDVPGWVEDRIRPELHELGYLP